MAKQFVALTSAMLVIVGAATQSAPAGELIPFKGKETGTLYVTFEPAGGSQATITGGTGRFEGAHGHYELRLFTEEPPLLDNLPIAATAEYEGVISSPGANRKRNK